LKEATTRQSHQDARRLLDELEWGNGLSRMSSSGRDEAIRGMIGILTEHAQDWLTRRNLDLVIDRRHAPTRWVNLILEEAKTRSGGVVEQHLVGAKLARRFQNVNVPNHPAHAADVQTERLGDFQLGNVVYHVTATPSRGVIQKCADNVKMGKAAILLVPGDQETKARTLADYEGIGQQLAVISIEGFVALNIIELAMDEQKDFFTVLKEIIAIYNQRLRAVETDLSLMIEVS
ncbi:MAG: DUF4928 family protein, partial [Anaerolineae bacterium]|nr:DUF4928 family protein [Anaerolineae bacterium]